MSTKKDLQNSGLDAGLQAPGNGANTGGNPFLPVNQNQMRQFFKVVKTLLEKAAKPEEWRVKASQPSPFKGDPEDLQRFLRQLENVFALEYWTFQQDIWKICYSANLLYKNKNDKFRVPASWYKSYYLKINANAAQRVLGSYNGGQAMTMGVGSRERSRLWMRGMADEARQWGNIRR